jgi:hypothetical protein
MQQKVIVAFLIIAAVAAQSCDMSLDERSDCGYMGINQQLCEAKGCCWKPARLLFT